MAAVGLLFLTTASAMAEAPIADVQWAQRVLTEKGFDIGGRANGQMTGPTRSALKAYQKANGLPATGEVDGATIEKMMSGRNGNAQHQGSLSAPRPGSAPRAPEKDVKPRAAPSERVQTQGGGENVNPAVAPSGPVDTSGWMPGQGSANPPAKAGGAPMAEGAAGPVSGTQTTLPMTGGNTESTAKTYARPMIAAVILGMLIAIATTWWMSGRRRRPAGEGPVEQAVATRRQEPTFGGGRDSRASADTGPLLTATRSARR